MSGTIYVRALEGAYLATVADLPGCMARGATKEEAADNARGAFRDYLALLEKYGVSTEHWKDLDPASFEVSDTDVVEWFAEDFAPLQEHEIRDFLHQMEGSRAALLALVKELSPEDLERKPTSETWSVRQALEHVMTTEASLLSRLERWPTELGALQAVHRMAFQRFSVLEPEDTKIDHRVMGQRWSTRRVMRRILEHEYEHMGHIREILAALGGDRQPS
ncbi:MAG: DinB family protein [Candidatus Limnocylindria bacterium]